MSDGRVFLLYIPVIVVLLIVFHLVGTLPDPGEDLRWHGQTVVLPTCKELDDLGYDGLASCVDSQGDVVRPGG